MNAIVEAGTVERELTGRERLEMLMASVKGPGIVGLLDLRLAEVGDGVAAFEATPSRAVYNPIGSVHGGYAATLLDSAMGLAVQTTLATGLGFTTLEFKVSFVRGMSETTGAIRTEGRVLSTGRRVATAEARITDEKDRLLAHATTTCLVFDLPKGA